MWPRGILNRSEPRNNMVYVSYDFYLINLVFIFIISHHSHMCPSPFFTEFSLPRHDRDRYRAFFNIAWSAQKISWISGHGMPDWWALRLESGWGKTISVSMLIDTLITYSWWVIQGTNISPCSSPTPTFSVSIWEHLAQNHIMFSKLLSICFSGDDWGHSCKIIVNYEDDYLKHHM